MALRYASERGWDISIASLCAEGINVNVADTNNEDYTALHLSVLGRHLMAAITLIRCGADIDAVDRDGNTSLHHAVVKGDPWMAGLLLLAKANPFISNRLGIAAYDMAMKADDPIFRTMFNELALTWFRGWRTLNDRDLEARNYISSGNLLALVDMCIQGRFDPNIEDSDNRNTAMHAAAVAQWNHPMLVQALVRCGGKVNVVNVQGNTPLHLAIIIGNEAATDALLLHGADPYIQNSDGQTAYSLGLQSKNNFIKALFNNPKFDWYDQDLIL